MAEYIERDKALDAVLQLPPKMDEQGYGWLGRMGVWQMLSDFPSADVAPVVHGKWELAEDGWYCTACELYPPFDCDPEEKGIPYCPFCGARMDGEE